ncbi:hypothetical protein [Salinibacter grassmerensis]|uniref:hypothetical protein n=1 Tax=Salinibacter grassmerensis TaxID=3040353 RepID=UPI0021E7D07A|nr:hypothetical protein [Salinibacter grassmerensis]
MWSSIRAVFQRIWGRLCRFDPAIKTGFQVFLVVSVLLVGTAGMASVSAISTLGAMLQLGGFLTVAVGIEKTLQSFGRKPFWKRLKEPFEDFWSIFTGGSVTIEGGTIPISTSTSVSAHVTPSYSDDLPLSEKIDLIKQDVERLESKLDELDERIEEEAERLEEKIEEEVSSLKEKMRQLREMVETANIGDITLRLEWFGVYLLIFGLLLSRFPDTAYALTDTVVLWVLSIL